MERTEETIFKTQGKVGDADGDGCALQDGNEAASQQAAGKRKRNRGSNNIQKTKHACILEAHESTRKRSESTLLTDHEDHIVPKGYMWSWERLTKIQTTTRPDFVWQEVWTKIGKAAQNLEKQEWAREKPKLDNARKMRALYFIDPDDEEYKDILKNARRKLERPMAPTLPCKRQKSITKVVAKPNSASEENAKTM